jgi:hypothetical protein
MRMHAQTKWRSLEWSDSHKQSGLGSEIEHGGAINKSVSLCMRQDERSKGGELCMVQHILCWWIFVSLRREERKRQRARSCKRKNRGNEHALLVLFEAR